MWVCMLGYPISRQTRTRVLFFLLDVCIENKEKDIPDKSLP